MFATLADDILKHLFQYLRVYDICNLQYVTKRQTYSYTQLLQRYNREEILESMEKYTLHTYINAFDRVESILIMNSVFNHEYKITSMYQTTHAAHKYIKYIFLQQQFLSK